ncbi:LuxR C-terminal-related transcriptional regulator [Streptomyces sp. NPDC092370]|uniref:helix-turn-helix transcriptional regulator n=1 Tax=Streptomyces sp. NPDC092370 TaxID=3366016 RepID=UPI0038177B55
MSLFWRIFSLNAVGLVVATALLLGPVTVSTPVLVGEALVLLGGLALLLAGNALVLRFGLVPLQRLDRAMATADLLRPGSRPVVAGPAETAGLITTYNTMLDRLETERAAGAARALSAQESERHRIARELHDEVGHCAWPTSSRRPSGARSATRLSWRRTAVRVEILKLVAEGHTSKEIGELLFISAKTVERHRADLLQKLGMRDRLELTRYAIRAGLIEP